MNESIIKYNYAILRIIHYFSQPLCKQNHPLDQNYWFKGLNQQIKIFKNYVNL